MEGSLEGAKAWREHACGGQQEEGRAEEKEPSLSAAASVPLPPPPAMSCGQGRGCWARLGNLSVLSEMSAEINLADPPPWPITLISLKFQAD